MLSLIWPNFVSPFPWVRFSLGAWLKSPFNFLPLSQRFIHLCIFLISIFFSFFFKTCDKTFNIFVGVPLVLLEFHRFIAGKFHRIYTLHKLHLYERYESIVYGTCAWYLWHNIDDAALSSVLDYGWGWKFFANYAVVMITTENEMVQWGCQQTKWHKRWCRQFRFGFVFHVYLDEIVEWNRTKTDLRNESKKLEAKKKKSNHTNWSQNETKAAGKKN